MSGRHDSGVLQNQLLAAMPSEVRGRLEPSLERVPLPLGEVLYESGGFCRTACVRWRTERARVLA
jgi:hypothetical protein